MSTRMPNLEIPNVTLPTGARKLREEFGSELYEVVTYHAFRRVRINGMAGTLFTTDGITDAMLALRERYSNVLILGGHSMYAPEQKRGHVFVADKRIRSA